MINLLKIELYKLKKFKFGYIAMIFMFAVGYLYGDSRLAAHPFDITTDTATVFSSTVCDTSFVFIIAIVSALFMGKDFSNRTICNEVKLGYSRFSVLLSRTIIVCAFSVLLHLIYVAAAIIGTSVVRGFDSSFLCAENVFWLLTVIIQLAAVICGVVLISFLTKKVSEAIAFSALYAALCCNILRNFLDTRLFTMSCFCFIQDRAENLALAAVIALITMIVFLAVTAFTFRKAEIK
ncbi:MAG: ABC transporter permease [Butyrivibrio sp.]|nr:ABC transporter permease [Acetatifactor muris]MCM1558104.1 ABC transporter permease [Butyrivibrio sp.]MCM1560467.1 ABC transporter permease [Butyrivibrio sp.]